MEVESVKNLDRRRAEEAAEEEEEENKVQATAMENGSWISADLSSPLFSVCLLHSSAVSDSYN